MIILTFLLFNVAKITLFSYQPNFKRKMLDEMLKIIDEIH